jgi:hypothetical protein
VRAAGDTGRAGLRAVGEGGMGGIKNSTPAQSVGTPWGRDRLPTRAAPGQLNLQSKPSSSRGVRRVSAMGIWSMLCSRRHDPTRRAASTGRDVLSERANWSAECMQALAEVYPCFAPSPSRRSIQTSDKLRDSGIISWSVGLAH